jgi:hypothetical protein
MTPMNKFIRKKLHITTTRMKKRAATGAMIAYLLGIISRPLTLLALCMTSSHRTEVEIMKRVDIASLILLKLRFEFFH